MVEYTTGTNKGATRQGELINSPFQLGAMGDRVDYTSARIVEEFTAASVSTGAFSATAAWFPVYNGTATDAKARIVSIMNGTTPVTVADDATVTVGDDGKTLTISNGTGTAIVNGYKVKVAYVYDNVVIPQNDLPIINAEMKSIPLIAKARRIAIYYSQMAAFQSKTDYGLALGDQLAQKAMSELQYKQNCTLVA